MSELTSLGGGSSGRKAKDELATQHEVVGFPASTARYHVVQAAKMIRIHFDRAGHTAELDHAMESLGFAAEFIEAWRAADQKRLSYPYIRLPKGHA